MTQASEPLRTEVRIRSAAPTFLVADVASTARWYVDHLGFQLAGRMPQQEPYAYASLQWGPVEIMLLGLPDYRKPDLRDQRPSGLWDVYFVSTVTLSYLVERIRNSS